ncbi:MAG TPA: hypothetical protein VGI58_00100 [Streptosporangiaceae bacterium]
MRSKPTPKRPTHPRATTPATFDHINWSGYTWNVRGTGGNPSSPGPNYWDNTSNTISVLPNGDLQMRIWYDGHHWRTGELDNWNALGYGTYKWVVDSDMSHQDLNTVLGLFTFDGGGSAPFAENDIEFSRWGNPSYAAAAFTVQPGGSGQQGYVQDVPATAPYTCSFTWLPGKISFRMTDAKDNVLGSYTSTTGVQAPGNAVPIINFWLFGSAPHTGSTQTVDIHSFSFSPDR